MQTDAASKFILTKHFLHLPEHPSITCCKCTFNLDAYNDFLYQVFNVHQPNSIQKAVKKRKGEFLAGRYMAQEVLSEYGFYENQVAIGKHRSPLWPSKLIGSITHNNNTAICAVSEKDNISALGIDIESCLNPKTIDKIKYSIIDRKEEELLANSPINLEEAFTIAFSIKESLFKALYPYVNEYFEFSAARIIDIDTTKNKLRLQLQQQLSHIFKSGASIEGNYLLERKLGKTNIFTYVVLPVPLTIFAENIRS